MIPVTSVLNGFMNSITYIVPIDSTSCWIVDCGDIDKVIDQGWKIVGVLLTHTHYDHIYGLNRLLELFPNAIIVTNSKGKEALLNPRLNLSHFHDEVEDFSLLGSPNIKVIDNDNGKIKLNDNLFATILQTPGHDSSCMSYIIDKQVFTGDAYIPGIKTVTTFPRSNRNLASLSLTRLMNFEQSDYCLHPGHKLIK